MTTMATYSLVKEQCRIVGLWLRDPADTENRTRMTYLLTKHDADKDVKERILMGFYEVRPNDVDERGGYFVITTDRNPRIAKPNSTSEFVDLVVLGAVLVECEVTIPDAIRTFDEVGHGLKGFGMETTDVVSHRERCFSTVCVKCHAQRNGAAVATVNLMRGEHYGAPITSIRQNQDSAGQLLITAEFGSGHPVTARGPGRVLRFYMGKCSNENCDSERVSMRWIVPA